ncbi:Zinc finger, C3HC4 type (RING finger), partial [Musa troglodytarum]
GGSRGGGVASGFPVRIAAGAEGGTGVRGVLEPVRARGGASSAAQVPPRFPRRVRRHMARRPLHLPALPRPRGPRGRPPLSSTGTGAARRRGEGRGQGAR